MNRIRGALTRKLGPLPAWVWLAVFAVGVIIYRARANNGINPVNVSDATPTPTDAVSKGDPVTLQPGESVYDPNTGAVSGGAPEQITPPDPTAPPDPVVLDPGQGVYDPGTGRFITNPGANGGTDSGTDSSGDSADTSNGAAAASGAPTVKGGKKQPTTGSSHVVKTKVTDKRGSGAKTEWKYNGHWHGVPPKDAVNTKRRVNGKVQYWNGSGWHSKKTPVKKPTQTMTGTAKPTTRTGGEPRAARVNPGRPVGAPGAVMSRPRSAATMVQPLVSKAGGVGTGTPPERARDNQAPGQSRVRSLPATIPTATVMRARPIPSPTVTPTMPHTSATPPPGVPSRQVIMSAPPVIKPPIVSKPQPKGTPTKMRPR